MNNEKLRDGKELDDSFAAMMRLMFEDGVSKKRFNTACDRYIRARMNLQKTLHPQGDEKVQQRNVRKYTKTGLKRHEKHAK